MQPLLMEDLGATILDEHFRRMPRTTLTPRTPRQRRWVRPAAWARAARNGTLRWRGLRRSDVRVPERSEGGFPARSGGGVPATATPTCE